MITTVQTITSRTGRNVELMLIVFAVAIVLVAWTAVDLGTHGDAPVYLVTAGAIFLAIVLGFHVVLRWRASYADPLLLPIATLLNGMGLVMIHRIDLSAGKGDLGGSAIRQLVWTAVAVAAASAVIIVIRDHRRLRRYTYTFMAVGVVLLLLPMVPGLGDEQLGSRVWIRIGSMSLQPGELAKIALAIFFAGYLVQTRDVLSLAGRRVLGFTFPRARDLGPILVAWGVSLAALVVENDFGFSLLLFGLFVVVLYVATERVSWVAIGLLLSGLAAYVAFTMVGHVAQRVHLWLDPFAADNLAKSDQLAKGLMGMAAGGLFGTGLGQGRPWMVAFADSDFIFASLGEELGLVGVFALLLLYVLFVERGIRTAIGVRDGFGKLLAVALAFSVALQCFVIIGGVTRVIPLTGLTTPFMSAGGSALLANWVLLALLLRISDQARRPVEATPTAPPEPSAPAAAKTELVQL